MKIISSISLFGLFLIVSYYLLYWFFLLTAALGSYFYDIGKYEGENAEYWFYEYDSANSWYNSLDYCVEKAVRSSKECYVKIKDVEKCID